VLTPGVALERDVRVKNATAPRELFDHLHERPAALRPDRGSDAVSVLGDLFARFCPKEKGAVGHGTMRSPEAAPRATALAVRVGAAAGLSMDVPLVVGDAGEQAARATLEFFTARIPNAHTRRAYGRAVFAFCEWCQTRGVRLQTLEAPTVSVRDFDDEGRTAALALHEKGGKERRIPCHHQTREYLRAYLRAAGFARRANVPLFQSVRGRTGLLSGHAIGPGKVWDVVKRRCKAAGLPPGISNHSFRATGITFHQENGGRLEEAQALAGRAAASGTDSDEEREPHLERQLHRLRAVRVQAANP
jgi:hypothetical protein